jgi:hypothetical protein
MSARINRRLADGAANLKSARDVAQQPALAMDLVIQRWAKDYLGSMAACALYTNDADRALFVKYRHCRRRRFARVHPARDL